MSEQIELPLLMNGDSSKANQILSLDRATIKANIQKILAQQIVKKGL